MSKNRPGIRKSFSVRRATYERVRRWCDREGVSVTSWAERALNEALDVLGEPVVTDAEVEELVCEDTERAEQRRERKPPPEFFTF